MKAKVIETGEEIDVYQLWQAPFCRMDCNGKIAEEYDIDELEFEPRPKTVSLDKICDWLYDKLYTRQNGAEHYVASKEKITQTEFVENLRKEFGE